MTKKTKEPQPEFIDINPGVRAWLAEHYGFDDKQLKTIAEHMPFDPAMSQVEYRARVHQLAEEYAFNRSGDHQDHWFGTEQGLIFLRYAHDRFSTILQPIRNSSRAINEGLGNVASPFLFKGTYEQGCKGIYNWLEAQAVREVQNKLSETVADDVTFERAGKPNRLGGDVAKNKVCRNDWANDQEKLDTVKNAIAKAWQLSMNRGGAAEAEKWAKQVAGIGPTGDWYDYEGDGKSLVTEIRRVANETRKQKLAEDEAAKAKEREQIDEALGDPEDVEPPSEQADSEPTQEEADDARHSGETSARPWYPQVIVAPVFEASFALQNPKGVVITFTIKAESGKVGLPIVNGAIATLLDKEGYIIPAPIMMLAPTPPGKSGPAAQTNSMDGDSGTAIATLITVASSQKGKPQLKFKLKGMDKTILFTARGEEGELVQFLKNATHDDGEKFTFESLAEGEFAGKWNVDWKKNTGSDGKTYTNAVAIRDM